LPNCHRQMHSSCRAQSHRSAAFWCDRGPPNHGWCPKEKHGTCDHTRQLLLIGFSRMEVQSNGGYQWSDWNWKWCWHVVECSVINVSLLRLDCGGLCWN
jgi:hypothetical protein